MQPNNTQSTLIHRRGFFHYNNIGPSLGALESFPLSQGPVSKPTTTERVGVNRGTEPVRGWEKGTGWGLGDRSGSGLGPETPFTPTFSARVGVNRGTEPVWGWEKGTGWGLGDRSGSGLGPQTKNQKQLYKIKNFKQFHMFISLSVCLPDHLSVCLCKIDRQMVWYAKRFWIMNIWIENLLFLTLCKKMTFPSSRVSVCLFLSLAVCLWLYLYLLQAKTHDWFHNVLIRYY